MHVLVVDSRSPPAFQMRCAHLPSCLPSHATAYLPTCSPQRYELTDAKLDNNFKRLQRTVHPDLFGCKTKREQDFSLEASSKLNVAYRVLKGPATRAQYLLQLHGIDAIGEAVGSVNADPALLLEIMEARELLEDASVSPATVARMKARVIAVIKRTVEDLTTAFNKKDLKRAADITIALQYYTRLNSEVDDWLSRREERDLRRPSPSPLA